MLIQAPLHTAVTEQQVQSKDEWHDGCRSEETQVRLLLFCQFVKTRKKRENAGSTLPEKLSRSVSECLDRPHQDLDTGSKPMGQIMSMASAMILENKSSCSFN